MRTLSELSSEPILTASSFCGATFSPSSHCTHRHAHSGILLTPDPVSSQSTLEELFFTGHGESLILFEIVQMIPTMAVRFHDQSAGIIMDCIISQM